jgi:hypothetical protein
MRTGVSRASTKRIALPQMLVAVLLLVANSNTRAAGPDEASLRYYPDAGRVSADVKSTYRDVRPGEADGRIAGQYLLLAQVLEGSWGGQLGAIGFERHAPPEAKRLRAQYLQAYVTVQGSLPALQPDCSGLTVAEQVAKGICARANFMEARSRQESDDEQVRQVAERYFPPQYQEAFVAHSGAAKWEEEQDAQEAQRQQNNARLESQREDAMLRRIAAGILLAVLSVLLAILALLMRRARRNRGRNTGSFNRIAGVEDIHLFDIDGLVIDVQRHTKTHITTTTTGGGYIHHDSWHTQPVSTTTTSRSTDHLALFVRTDEGRELQESFVDMGIGVRTGSRVSIVYAGDRWSRSGLAVAVANLDTGDVAIERGQAGRIASRYGFLKAAFWGVVVAMAGAFVDMLTGVFLFILPALALGGVSAVALAVALQVSLRARIAGQIAHYATTLPTRTK